MTNHLGDATSPYLLQHASNPVDWWPWCDEAFDEARRRDLPVFLSIGYSACHWCHVMAHESFEDQATAALLNDRFVSIKVDREERPDIDAVYLAAVQGMTGHGGWPMTIFLDHGQRPFHAGTYYPKDPLGVGPTFGQLLLAIGDAWTTRRTEVTAGSAQIAGALAGQDSALQIGETSAQTLADRLADVTETAVDVLARQYDSKHAGFGTAPKFPPSTELEFLLRRSARHEDPRPLAMVRGTCEAMARGGMYDQLAGGFSRYSVDNTWTVPHFEKMLSDNALLLRIYAHWFRAVNSPFAERVVRQTAEFMLNELRTGHGGFAAALDADAPAEPGGQAYEGQSYAWTPDQLIAVLGEADGRRAAKFLNVTEAGTFKPGTSVLTLSTDPAALGELPNGEDPTDWWVRTRALLLADRDARPQPARDDKVVAAWNGLAIAALADAGALLGVPAWIAAARAAATLLVEVHLDVRDGKSRLWRVSKDGLAGTHAAGVLEDYADVAEGFLALATVTGEQRWREIAGDLLETVMEQFTKPGGGFYDTAIDSEQLIIRPSDPADLACPSGWSAATSALLSYGALMTSARHLRAAETALEIADTLGRTSPRFAGWLLATAEAYLDGPREIVIVGDEADPNRRKLHQAALASTAPGLVIAVGDPQATQTGEGDLLRIRSRSPFSGRPIVDGHATAYACEGTYCYPPVTTVEDLQAYLD